MITVTLCDDNQTELGFVESIVNHHFSNAHTNFSLSLFSSSVALNYELQDNKISDIYILDVSMPILNGFQIAEEIRKKTSHPIIIFLTSHAEYASVGYRYKALRYVSKITLERDLPEALDCALLEIGKSDPYITLRHYNDLWKIPYSDIVYVVKLSRRLEIVTETHGNIPDKRGINEFYTTLNDDRFLFIDRSCFVNIDYASCIIDSDLKTTTGETLPISRRSYSKVFAALAERWANFS